MKNLLKLEELAMFAIAYIVFTDAMQLKPWLFWSLILTPDIGMLGYLVNAKVGSFTYNIFHHKGIALAFAGVGWLVSSQVLLAVGVILFAHSSLDRLFGYGLKYPDSFKKTHLGTIGKQD